MRLFHVSVAPAIIESANQKYQHLTWCGLKKISLKDFLPLKTSKVQFPILKNYKLYTLSV